MIVSIHFLYGTGTTMHTLYFQYELRQEAERAGQTKAEDNDNKTSEEDDHTWMLSSTANSLDSPDLHSTRV